MIPILTPQQMLSADRFAISRLRIPSLQLMENAGSAVAAEIQKRKTTIAGRSVVIFCGKGNNGGDGFVAARMLRHQGADVTVVLMDDPGTLSDDALVNFNRLQDHNTVDYFDFQARNNKRFDVIVDAMFGTSFKGTLSGQYLSAVEWCNRQKGLKVAVDIPSGLHGESGETGKNAFRADVTVTLSNPKIGFYRGNGKDFTGEVVIADIGIPGHAIERVAKNIFLIERSDIREIIPDRPSNSHKHSVGKLFVLAGSHGMTGAAMLCSQSAMRSGAGQVILGIPESEYPIVARRTLEVMPLGLPATSEGTLAFGALSSSLKKIEWADVVCMGCGMSRNKETMDLIANVVRKCRKTMVIDADGLFALAENLTLLKRKTKGKVILTPHMGEFSRLLKKPVDTIEQLKFEYSRAFSKKYGVTLVLKGSPTIICDSHGTVFVNPTGNPGMSTAGSGDVLAGIISAIAGQGSTAEAAAVSGVYLHGIAGDIAATKKGVHGMIASDMIKWIPSAFLSVVA